LASTLTFVPLGRSRPESHPRVSEAQSIHEPATFTRAGGFSNPRARGIATHDARARERDSSVQQEWKAWPRARQVQSRAVVRSQCGFQSRGVVKRLSTPCPDRGLIINMCAVAGLRSASMVGDLVRGIFSLGQSGSEPRRLAERIVTRC